MLILNNCTKQSSVVTSNNRQYNELHKSQSHISPIGNVVTDRQSEDLLKKNYEYYAQGYQGAKNKYDAEQKHMLFLVKNHQINQIKNVSVETLPVNNKEYIIDIAEVANHRDINKKAYLEIEYAMFVNEAKLTKKFREQHGDPIIHPYTYTELASGKKRIVIGDEYDDWRSICETHSEAC